MPLTRFSGLLTDPRIRAAYAEGAGIYRIVPAGVAVPQAVEELQHLVRWAVDTGTPLVPRGAGSGMPGGNVGPGVIVDLSQAFHRVAPDWSRRTVWAGASVTWADVNDAARPFGLRLPPDPSSGAFATSGGMVATNAAGPRSLQYGSVRGWVEAVQIVTGDGEARTVSRGGGAGPWHLTPDTRHLVTHGFPKTRKNSSGYAFDRFAESGDELDLLIGSEGTLAFITAVQWRLAPLPPHVAGAALGFTSLEAVGAAVHNLVALNPSAVELLDRTFLAWAGHARARLPEGLDALLLVEFDRDTPASARGAVGDAVRALKALATHVETAVDRRGLERLWAMRKLASPALARLPDTTGREWQEALAGLFRDVTDLLIRLGGTPSGEHGDGRLRAGVLERVYGPEVVALCRDLKRVHDPRSILNPGVIIPSADWAPLAELKVGPDRAPMPDDIATRLREIERTAGWATPKLELARPSGHPTPDT